MIKTQAWVLEAWKDDRQGAPAGKLQQQVYAFSDLTEHEVLAEPIYGSWEGNMSHAIKREPIDICRQREEEKVVIGNAGVVRVLKVGASVKTIKENDLCIVFCHGVSDRLGYPAKIYAYDAVGTVGLLAKQTKLDERQLIPVPHNTRHSLKHWAAFSLRYVTAWANWKLAYGCWQLQAAGEASLTPFVWGWGGGVTLAELLLARLSGCEAVMISSQDERLKLIESLGIRPIDRRAFCDLKFDQQKYHCEPEFRKKYLAAESAFLEIVEEQTHGQGVSIFVDFIGLPVFRATLKSLGRPGVVTTAGWKDGMKLSTVRAIECMNWHVHVHTHYARYAEALEAVSFAEERAWMPLLDDRVYDWESIPQLAEAYAAGEISTYFPIFQVNSL